MDTPLPANPELPRDLEQLLASVAPLTIDRPTRQTAPLVLVSAHSGQHYPADLVAATRLDAAGLRRSEDSFVDELFAAAPGLGVPLLRAHFARAYCDANREAWELDPAMFQEPLPDWVNTASPRVTAGLGTIARVVASGEPIYRDKLSFADAQRRVHTLWQPFHDALAALIAHTHATFGVCVVIDCHSMPTSSPSPRAAPDVVLGDAHGTTCSPSLTREAERTLVQLGYRARRNDPYAGGYITRHYGRPREGVHALQIELARSLYMDEGTLRRTSEFATLQANLTIFITSLIGTSAGLLP